MRVSERRAEAMSELMRKTAAAVVIARMSTVSELFVKYPSALDRDTTLCCSSFKRNSVPKDSPMIKMLIRYVTSRAVNFAADPP